MICFSSLGMNETRAENSNNEVNLSVSISEENPFKDPFIKRKKNCESKKKIMITPCKHQFHIKCLKKWMNLKLECPTCRKPLPPID